ncbi:MAG: alpha/beta fold hydrolase [Bacteroidetes bacterium]|nr:alpha/beta fold hydrolase [Bacteroidota bacterium]
MQNIILLHGALGSKKQLEPLEQILKKNFQVFSFDFEGHGEQEETEKHYSIGLFSKNLLSFMNQNGLKQACIFGYSMGGYVALYTAKLYPERFTGIFTLATKFDWNPETSRKEAAMLNPEKIKEKVPKFALELENRHGNKWEALLMNTAQMMLEMGANPPFSLKDAAEVKTKSLLSVGENDVMVSLEETAAVQKSIPGAKFLVLPATPHQFEKVNLNDLVREIKGFLDM